jgi:ParB family chromosome partitioning protein
MSVKKPALGRGLEALFSSSVAVSPMTPSETPTLRQIPIDEIHPNPFQPRTDFNPEKLRELADSIRVKGVLQPIVLRRTGTAYQLVAGERRWRAAQQAGLDRIPAVVRDYDDQEMMEAALVENIQRDDLNSIEEARAYERLLSQFEITQEALADALGKSRVSVTNALRLLKLPREILDLIMEDKLSAGHGRALLMVESAARQITLARQALQKGLSVREVEKLVKEKPGDNGSTASEPQALDDVTELQEKLTQQLGVKVKLMPRSNTTGKIEIYYTSLDEFHRVCSQLGINFDQAL